MLLDLREQPEKLRHERRGGAQRATAPEVAEFAPHILEDPLKELRLLVRRHDDVAGLGTDVELAGGLARRDDPRNKAAVAGEREPNVLLAASPGDEVDEGCRGSGGEVVAGDFKECIAFSMRQAFLDHCYDAHIPPFSVVDPATTNMWSRSERITFTVLQALEGIVPWK